MTPLGRKIDLSEGRVVFVGARENDPNYVCIGFKNAQKTDTVFKLTPDAAQALVQLLTAAPDDAPKVPFPFEPKHDEIIAAVWKIAVWSDEDKGSVENAP